MEDKNSGNKLFITLGAILLVLGFLAGLVSLNKISEQTEKPDQSHEPDYLTMSQLKMKEAYGWKDVILWIESKENFEKAYGDSLRKTGHAMLFTKDPMCTGPFGETGDWECEKMCFRYVVPEENPNVINEIAEKFKGKTLVIIGSLFNNGTEFGGNAYWCENKK